MEFSNSAVGAYLSYKLKKSCEVVEIEKFGRGSSRETYFVTFHSSNDMVEQLVFRRDFATGSTDYSPLSQEFFIYERLGHTNVPVAKALWWEDDPAWTDRQFYVRQHVDGSWNVAHFSDPSPEYDDLRIRISKEHMRKLALVHAVDWKALGLDKALCTAPSVEQCARHYIESIADSFEEFRIEPIPIFLEAKEWLIDQAPVASKICLCKGTNGLGEEIFRGEEIVALSDWEEAQIGDPAADFAYMQNFAPDVVRNGETIWGLKQALDYYHSVGGAAISVASVQYYQLVRAFRMLAFSHRAASAVHRSPGAPIRQAWTGTEIVHLGKHILASAMGLMPPPDAKLFLEIHLSVENA